jgi:anti-sigma B factor antagonist
MGLFNKNNMNTASSSGGNSNLKISTKKDGAEYTLLLNGRLDTITSPALDDKINEVIGGAEKLIIDLSELEYISSAGLRVLLGTLQIMEGKGEMVICNLTEPVREVFELTGFSRLFNIE